MRFRDPISELREWFWAFVTVFAWWFAANLFLG